MNSLNLVEDIKNTQNNESNIYIENETNSSYLRYLELLDMYFSESCKPKFINKFNYYVDNEGRFVKEAIEKSNSSDSMVIVKPKYIDITNRVNELDETIKQMETNLRQYRSGLLNNDLSIKDSFDKLYKMYTNLLNERNSIKDYNNKVNNLDTNSEIKLKLKLDNINLNLTQYSLFNSIKLFNEDEDIEKYLLNNEVINSNITKSISLKNKTINKFLVSEIFDNNLPTKKTIKAKKLKKKVSPKSKPEPEPEPKDTKQEPTPKLDDEEEEPEEEDEEEKEQEPKDKKEKSTLKVEEQVYKTEEPASKLEKDEDDDQDDDQDDDEEDLGLEEVDLSKDAVDQSDIKVDLKSLFNDSESDEEYIFNKEEKPPTSDSEDLDLDLQESTTSKSKGKSKAKSKDVDSNEEIDLEKLSKQLNKKAKGNIKLVKVDKNLKFSDIKCDDSKTKRSDVKTTNIVNGKKTRKKGTFDQELKKCMFPFKEIKGRGKNKKEIVYNECTDQGGKAEWCATERKDDCSMKKWAYCEN